MGLIFISSLLVINWIKGISSFDYIIDKLYWGVSIVIDRINISLKDLVLLYGQSINQRIKGTLGITGLFCEKVLIGRKDWHLDVGSSHPSAEYGWKGFAVRKLKAVRELGLKRCETV